MEGSVVIRCPSCKKTMQAAGSYAEKKVNCINCGYQFWATGENLSVRPIAKIIGLFYLMSFLMPASGIIVAAIFTVLPRPENRYIGRRCLVFSVFGLCVWFAVIAFIWGQAV